MKVEVYKNLHKNCWSVRDNKTGKVIDYVVNIHLADAKLVVRPAGRKRVLREQRKNVHAFIKGDITTVGGVPIDICEVVYNPYEHMSFIEKVSGKPIHNAKNVFLTSLGKVYVEKNQ